MPEWPRSIREELRQHLDDEYRDLRVAGMSHEDAMRAMSAEVAALERQPQLLDAHGLSADLRDAVRTVKKSFGFSAVVLVTLALGIGATTAIFSVLNAVLLRPLPYDRDGRLVVVWGNLHKPGLEEIPASAAEFVDYRDRNRVFDSVAAYDTRDVNVTGLAQPERVRAVVATASLFTVLGAVPAIGRPFDARHEQPGRDDVALVSDRFWRQQLGSDPRVVGRALTIEGRRVEIVGVMAPEFAFPEGATDVWQPVAFTAEDVSDDQRGSHSYTVLGRLRRGSPVDQAQSAMQALGEQIGREHRNVYRVGFSASVRPLRDELVGNVGPALWVLMGAVALVLCIACVNVASLLLARATGRQKEMAIRSALGASRLRLVRQLLVESVLMAIAGGAMGLAMAWFGVRTLVMVAPGGIPRVNEVAVDARVLIVTGAVSMLTGVLFGVVPALQMSAWRSTDALKEGGRSGDAHIHSGLRQALVAAEVALSLVLLTGAGLLIASFARLRYVDPGFRADHLLTARLSLPPTESIGQAQNFFDNLTDRLGQQAGIEAAAAINAVPFSGRGGDRSFFIEGRPVAPGEPSPDEQVRFVTAGYFSTMNISVRGREFSVRDVRDAPHVAVVNEAFARKYWPGGDAIGKRVQFTLNTTNKYEIVGVAGNVRHRALDAAQKPELYVPVFQPLFDGFRMPPMDVVIRTTAEPVTVIPTLRAAVAALDRDQPVGDVRTMEERIGGSLAARRFNTVLLALFAAIALVLAAIGLSGLVAYAVARRTHEIGVRLALGAQPREIVSLLVAQGMTPALVGAGIGLAAAVAATRAIASLLFGVRATDLATFAAVTALLLAVALAACWLPARRATRVDPMLALRGE